MDNEDDIKIPENLFGKYQFPTKTKITNRRQYMIKQFVDELNLEVKKGQRKWTPYYIALRLGHLKKLEDLDYLYSICKDYQHRSGSFSKCFFGSLKVK